MKAPVRAVAIGASAGGVEALSAVLPALPRGFPAAVFVVIHLPRDKPSVLADIFAARCEVPVREAQDKEPVQPGVVYFAPPDYHLLVDEGPSLALSVDDPVLYSRPSIDVLFQSAADVYGPQLAGVVLTGGNEDGCAGLQAIAKHDGACIVQDPATAQAAYMPRAAMEKVASAQVLPLDRIATALQVLTRVDNP